MLIDCTGKKRKMITIDVYLILTSSEIGQLHDAATLLHNVDSFFCFSVKVDSPGIAEWRPTARLSCIGTVLLGEYGGFHSSTF